MKILLLSEKYNGMEGYDTPSKQPFPEAFQETYYEIDTRWNLRKTQQEVSRSVDHEITYPDGKITRVIKESITEIPSIEYEKWFKTGIRHNERVIGTDILFERYLPKIGWFIEIDTLAELLPYMKDFSHIEAGTDRYDDIPLFAVLYE